MANISIEELVNQQGLFHGTHTSYVDSIRRSGLNADRGRSRARFLQWGWQQIALVENETPRSLLDKGFHNLFDPPPEGGMPGLTLLDASLRGAVYWKHDSVAFAVDFAHASDYAGGYGESVGAARALGWLLSTRYRAVHATMPSEFAPYVSPLPEEELTWTQTRAVFRLVACPPLRNGHFHLVSSADPVDSLSLRPGTQMVQISELMFSGVVPPDCLELVGT